MALFVGSAAKLEYHQRQHEGGARRNTGASQHNRQRRIIGWHFDKDERVLVDEAIKEAADAVELILEEGIETAMNRYNAKKK